MSEEFNNVLEIDRSGFKAANGSWNSRSLFYETYLQTELPPVFTLKAEDYTVQEGRLKGTHLLSMKRMYMENALPESEYDFAMLVFGSYDHWKTVRKLKWFQEHYVEWVDESEARTRAQAIRNIHMDSMSSSKSSVSSAKWLADANWKMTKDKPKRGRPSNAEVERERKVAAAVKSDLTDDWERITGSTQ